MRFFRDLSFTIIGNGALGGALTDFLEKNSYAVRSIFNSRGGIVNHPDGSSRKTEHTHPENEYETGDVIFICVPDDYISEIAIELSQLNLKWNTKKVIHCSGNLFSDELDALAIKGVQTASMHPLQTFQPGDNADRFEGVFVSLEGQKELCEGLEGFVGTMGSKPLRVQKKQKQMLHIAAVFASNYVVTVLHKAENLLKDQGIDNGLEPLEPLIRQTIENSLNLGTLEALTGPIARGDAESVRKHLKALKDDSVSTQLYRVLGMQTLKIAQLRGVADAGRLKALEQILQPEK
jgi:predicted short-subunit dehydrogenase-like oxidoreductase (DUF2520 family)